MTSFEVSSFPSHLRKAWSGPSSLSLLEPDLQCIDRQESVFPVGGRRSTAVGTANEPSWFVILERSEESTGWITPWGDGHPWILRQPANERSRFVILERSEESIG
jgi:hypothetical protein